MTNEDLAEYYANLLILQYIGQPNAYATIKLMASVAILNQLPLFVQAAYDIDSAVGVQLDVLGKYCGVVRTGYGTAGPITLDDDDFRKLIKLAIIKNNSGTSMADIQNQLFSYFGTAIRISDSANMQLNYAIENTFGTSDLQNMIVYQGLLPRPMGVAIAVSFVPPGVNNFFTLRTYSAAAPTGTSPLNSYTFYNLNYPWISYTT